MAFTKATRTNSKLRLAITGTAGAGKTYGALLIAQGLGGKIALIDTENGSGNVYADICDYDICTLTPPYDPRRYIQIIREAEQAGYNIIIVDSISHEWSGEGGCLDLHTKETAASRSGNGYVAWGKITPLHNMFIQAMTASSCHIIATMRCKTDYAQVENERGRTEIRKVGLAPIQRDGVDYEFGTVFDISANHMATVTKDRSRIFPPEPFIITPKVGEALRKWLDSDTPNSNTQKGAEA